MAKSNGIGETPYEKKFAEFVKMCSDSDIDLVLINNPEALGDTYDEIVESLNRLSDAEKKLSIVPRKERKKSSANR